MSMGEGDNPARVLHRARVSRLEPGIVRYAAFTRLNHWTGALCFFAAALSGLALFHPALFWVSTLFGGGPWTRILHPFLGLAMVVSFCVLSIRLWRANTMESRDWEWLGKISDVVLNREDRLPDVGEYNAGQKLLFFVIALCLTALLLSGIGIWQSYFSAYFPIALVRLSALAHAFFAFVLICSIIVHIYAAIWVKGSIPAMTRGTVSLGWAWKHHRLWFRSVTRNRPLG